MDRSIGSVGLRALVAAFIAVVVLAATLAMGRAQTPAAQAKTMLVLDASGSMWGRIGRVEKIAVARSVIADLMSDWDQSIHLGLTAYGHRRKGDCTDIETLIPVGGASAARIPDIVNRISPKGKTPLSDAVRRAAEDLRYTEQAATVILVTDGLETCNADPCAVAEALEDAGVNFTAHVIGFDITEEESRSVRCVAELTGGEYHSAHTADELRRALESTRKAAAPPPPAALPPPRVQPPAPPVQEAKARPAEPLPPPETDKVRLALVEGGPLLEADDFMMPNGNVSRPAEFSFFDTLDTGAPDGERVAHSEGWQGVADVQPGDHVVRVKFGLVEQDAPLTVRGDGTRHVVALNAAIIRLNPIVSEGALTASNAITWSAFAGNDATSEALGTQLDQGLGGFFVLPPGAYFMTGRISGVAKAFPLNVVAGDNISIDVDLRSGTLNARAVLAEGGAAATGYFKWDAYSVAADGRSRGELLVSGVPSATTKLELPAGPNIIVFRDKVVEREFVVDIAAEQTHNRDFPIDAGVLQYRVVDADGKVVSGYPRIDIYPRGADTSTDSVFGKLGNTGPAGRAYVPAGSLDIVVRFAAGQREYSLPFEIRAGETKAVDLIMGG